MKFQNVMLNVSVISNEERGEISSNGQISPNVEMTGKQ